ncbi:hypothetical protein ABPG74_013408 [Tetrahymena malaccensis]
MGNCQETKRSQYENDDNTIDAPTPEQKSRPRERTQNETSMKFISQPADDDNYFGTHDDLQKFMEVPKKMIRKQAPKFEANAYHDGYNDKVKKVSLDDYQGKYLVLFFYPYDFNKQFQEEILDFSENYPKFKKLNCELLGCSIDSHFSHMNYCNKPRNEGGLGNINFPLMADVDKKIAADYGVLNKNGNDQGTCLRSTFIIDDQQIVRHLAMNDFAGHLRAEEILRMVKGIQDNDRIRPKSQTAADKSTNKEAKQESNSKSFSNLPSNKKTVFEKIGGEAAIEAAVKIFYKKMLADPKVSSFFKDIDMTKQHTQQVSFLSFALGGPKKYVGKSMRDAHQYLRLTNAEFDITVGHLVSTLKDLNIDEAVITEIGKMIEPLRKDVVFTQSTSIYDQIGGEKAMEQAVEIFYKKMLEDPKVSSFFKPIDMNKQKQMQKAFLTMALGGPKEYKGRNMKDAHSNLNLTDEHFDVTVGHLIGTLKQLNVDDKIIKQIGVQIEPLRKDIVSAKASMPSQPQLQQNISVQSQKESVTASQQPKTLTAPAPQQQPKNKLLIDRIGGEAKVEVLVGLLVDRIYSDQRINAFFATIEAQKHKDTLKSFLVQLTGGPKNYKGKNLREAHSALKINDVQFNAFMTHLRESLKQMKVEPSVFYDFCGLFESLRPQIVTVKLQIFERLGGEAALVNLSDKLYQKVTADDRIKDFFVNIDMSRMREQMKNFLMLATGGPNMYKGKNMKEAHAKLKINDIHFNAFKENLLLTLKEELVDPQTFLEISNLIETQRMTIVTQSLPLFERIGGEKGVLQIVNRFYDRILMDQRIKKFFQGVDMNRLRNINHQFLLYCVKGATSYTGKSMKEAHMHLGLNDTHFNLVKDHLLQAMKDCSKDPLSLIEVGGAIEALRNDIVSVKVPLFDRVGGEPITKKAVERLYAKLMADAKLKDFFKTADMQNLKNSQCTFLTVLLGGPNNYKGKSMKEAHQNLKLNDSHFNIFKELVQQSFREVGIDNITIAEIARAVEQIRKEIVSIRPPLYERIGGEKSLEIIIEKFYDKLIKNQAIGQFFVKTDPIKQKNMLKAFFTTIFGGQQMYKGKKLKEAHANMKITDAQFNEFRSCMEQTLKEINQFNVQLVKEVAAVIDHFRKEIVVP